MQLSDKFFHKLMEYLVKDKGYEIKEINYIKDSEEDDIQESEELLNGIAKMVNAKDKLDLGVVLTLMQSIYMTKGNNINFVEFTKGKKGVLVTGKGNIYVDGQDTDDEMDKIHELIKEDIS